MCNYTVFDLMDLKNQIITKNAEPIYYYSNKEGNSLFLAEAN
jgi:hypothetical protein